MGEIVDFKDRVKRFYTFSFHEIRSLTVAILVVGFVISFAEWGRGDTVELSTGLFNLFNAIMITALSFLVHDAGTRLWGIGIGYRVEYKLWGIGLVIGVIVAFLTNGGIWLILPSGFIIHHLSVHRLGWFRYGVNYFAQATIAVGGILATLFLVVVLKILGGFFPTTLVEKAIVFNIIYAITCLLPIPPLDGSKIYFGSRMLYAFFTPAALFAAILFALQLNVILSVLIAVFIGTALWIGYYLVFEKDYWERPN